MAPRHLLLVAVCLKVMAAFPSFRNFIPNGRRIPCPENGKECQAGDPTQCEAELACNGLGHQTCKGGTLPLNLFGEAFQRAGYRWSRELCEADSDGDGLTNGEEIGDPCCLWQAGSAPSLYTKRFSPTHPGVADSHVKIDAYTRPACDGTVPVVAGANFGDFVEGEEQRTVDIHIRPFNVPAQRTTYVDFLLNIPDSAFQGASAFYLVKAEALVDKKEVLHHFVILGCSKKVPESMNGKQAPMGMDKEHDCTRIFGGWAPGAYIASFPPWIGQLIGPAAGIVALSVQIHYDNPREANNIVDASGMRFWYTPTPRKHPESYFFALGVADNEEMVIPSGAERWFLTRTCTLSVIDDACDLNGDFLWAGTWDAVQMQHRGASVTLTGTSSASWSTASGTYTQRTDWGDLSLTFDNGVTFQGQVTCGNFGTKVAWIGDASVYPALWSERWIDKFHVLGVNYHAHLLGVQMYSELLPADGSEPVDLGSEQIWNFDDQYTRDLLALNITFRTGDRIQSTCVMNSMGREAGTVFGSATIHEMCLVVYKGWSSVPGSIARVSCEGPVWAGELLSNEPGFGIAQRHPVEMALHRWDGSDLRTGGSSTGAGEAANKEQEVDLFESIALSADAYYNIRTVGCAVDQGTLKSVSVRLPDELVFGNSASTPGPQSTEQSDERQATEPNGEAQITNNTKNKNEGQSTEKNDEGQITQQNDKEQIVDTSGKGQYADIAFGLRGPTPTLLLMLLFVQ